MKQPKFEGKTLFEVLGTRCWYCGAKFTLRDNLTSNEVTFPINSCASCRSRRRGKPLDEFRLYLAEREGSGQTKQHLKAALATGQLDAADAELIGGVSEKLKAEHLFFIERVFRDCET